ncbi:aminotransferase class I/II-fold pyridoxal phosphate-dependent enzyme [Erwinia sp. E602]|uniref:MalY/PatB family protein n=1 Tax=Erwinia sp. E602 TaxID=2675378 RepID=UPI001BA70B72|nr:aminotransferase class I/II-fold pyridoxal phosphate-dependent enzyme [Erwinia sp. E602]QUG75350.1 aminotransferase class I/II-fold pyridoxal phosphate-dependent enzyme [Erwinia sp. E602]
MRYDFDEIVDRSGTDSLTIEGWREYMFGGHTGGLPSAPEGGFINLWVADMAFATPQPVLDAVHERLNKKILGYTRAYNPEYLEIFASWCQRHYEYRFAPESIVLSPGIIPALNRLVPLLTRENESVLILTPSYAPFKKAGEYSGRRVVSCPMVHASGEMSVDFSDLERLVKDPQLGIKVFFLCNPHNPTGRVWRREELHRMAEICLQNDVWVISDEIHCDLSRTGIKHTPAASLFPDSNKIITCMSSSKTFNLAGNLLAHIMIPDPVIRTSWLRLYDDMLSPLSLVANLAAWSQCDDWLTQVRQYIDGNFVFLRAWLEEHHPQVRFDIPDGTYLAWLDLSPLSSVSGKEYTALYFAQQAGVLVEDAGMFVGNGDGHIRLNLACPRAMLEEGLRRLTRSLNTHF